MTQTVQLPNGETMAVPDHYGPEEIQQAWQTIQTQDQQVSPATGTAPQAFQQEDRGFEFFPYGRPEELQAGLGSLKSAVTGEGRIPEESRGLGEFEASEASTGDQMRLAGGFLLNMDPEARKDIIRNTLGDEAEITEDSQGNTIVEYRGERAFLNKPGFSLRDATQLAGEVLKFVPAARMVGAIQRTIPRVLAGGTGTAATEAASQGASIAAGSEQGIDPVTVAAIGAGGATGEALAAPARQFTRQARETMQRGRETFGLNLKGEPGEQVRQVARTAGQRAAPERGESLEAITPALREKATEARAQAGRMFDEAQEAGGAIPSKEIERLRFKLGSDLERSGFDIEDMPKVRKRLEELPKLVGEGKERLDAVGLERLERWRKRINKNRSADPAEQAALGNARRIYDDWLEEQFNRDMIEGTPEAINKWREARSAWRRYKEQFEEDEVIRKLWQEDNATPESMRSWILNSSDVRMNKQAGEVVRRLNELLGESSPEMGKLRSEVWLNIVEPLLRDDPLNLPNIRQFLRNYEEVIKRNPTLVKRLWPDGLGELEELQKFARGIAKRPGSQQKPEAVQNLWDRVWDGAVTLTVGHGIAKGGFRTRTGRGVVERLREATAGAQGRKTILREVLGYDPKEPMIPPGVGTLLGATKAKTENAENPPPR